MLVPCALNTCALNAPAPVRLSVYVYFLCRDQSSKVLRRTSRNQHENCGKLRIQRRRPWISLVIPLLSNRGKPSGASELNGTHRRSKRENSVGASAPKDQRLLFRRKPAQRDPRRRSEIEAFKNTTERSADILKNALAFFAATSKAAKTPVWRRIYAGSSADQRQAQQEFLLSAFPRCDGVKD